MSLAEAESKDILDVTQLIDEPDVQDGGFMPPEEATIDVGNLTAISYLAPLDEDYNETATKLVQELLNKVFCLPVEKTSVGPMVLLPPTKIPIPREKNIPVPRSETKWEKFAKEKGIRKRKKETKVWDQTTGTWKRTWGKDSIKQKDDWLVECDPDKTTMRDHEDPFIQKVAEKKQRVLKQKRKEIANKRTALISTTKEALGSKTATPFVIGKLSSTAKGLSPAHLSRAIHMAQRSTRSLGAFDTQRSDEPLKKKKKAIPQTRDAEKKISERVLKGITLSSLRENVVDGDKMANQIIREKKKKPEPKNRQNRSTKKRR